MNFLKHCCVRGIPDADARLGCVQVPKHGHEHVYQSPNDSRHHAGGEVGGEAWWPVELRELFDSDEDEYYLGRLTFLSRPAQAGTGDLAIEYLGGGAVRRWRWAAPPRLQSYICSEGAAARGGGRARGECRL